MRIDTVVCNNCRHSNVCKYKGLFYSLNEKLTGFTHEDPDNLITILCKCKYHESLYSGVCVTGRSINDTIYPYTLCNDTITGVADAITGTANLADLDCTACDNDTNVTKTNRTADTIITNHDLLASDSDRIGSVIANAELDHELDHDKVHTLAYENAVYNPNDSTTIKSFMD